MVKEFNITMPISTRQWDCKENITYSTLTIIGVEAFGENINLMIIAVQLRKLCRKLIGVLPNELVELTKNSNLFDEVIGFSQSVTVQTDFYANILDIAQNITLELNGEPYLTPSQASLNKWQLRLASMPKLKIGLAWQGEPTRLGDAVRSTDLPNFAPLFTKFSDAGFVSLQKGKKQLETYPESWQDKLFNAAPYLHNYDETAGLIKNLSIVISTDTSVPHLAAALGIQTILLLPNQGTDWRWAQDKVELPFHKTMWYKSMVIMRQHPNESWQDTIKRITTHLSLNNEIYP